MNLRKYFKEVSEGGLFSKGLAPLFLVTQAVLLLAFISVQGYWRVVPEELPALKADYPLSLGGDHETAACSCDPDNKCLDSFSERRARLVRVCKDQPSLKHARAENIQGNRQAGLTVCIVHKAASTVWMRLLFLMNNRGRRTSDEALLSRTKWDIHRRFLRENERFYLYKQRDIVMRTYRALTARNPYSRLWSAYVDKFLFLMFKVVGEKIVKRFRANATEKEIACGHDVTYEEFVRYVVEEDHKSNKCSRHWLPVADVCDPCTLKPDFIAKQETLGEDIKAIVQRLGLSYETDDMFVKAELETTIRDELDVHMRGYDGVKDCMTKQEYLRRIWKGLMVNGYLQPNTGFLEKFEQLAFNATVVSNYILQMPGIVTDTAARNELRQKAMVTAFQRIPDRDMIGLQRLYKLDFVMFDYSTVSFI